MTELPLISSTAPSTTLPPIAIIAGNGSLPLKLFSHLKEQGHDVLLIGLKNQSQADLPTAHWFHLGEAGNVIKLLKSNNIKDLVMIGPVKRPSVKELKPDATARKILGKGLMAFFKGDNAILTIIKDYLQTHHDIKIRGIHEFMPYLLVKSGALGHVKPSQQAQKDILKAMKILHDLSPHDIGQSLVIQQGLILGIEAIEGTDLLISRCAKLAFDDVTGPILVKAPKLGQDKNLDLPTIGLPTLDCAIKGGYAGIAFACGGLMVDQERMIERANEKGVFLYGIKGNDYE